MFKSTRICSLSVLKELGYEVSASLPMVDDAPTLRDSRTVARRLLGLYGIVALSFGWKARQVPIKAWVENEQLIGYLTPLEDEFLRGDETLVDRMQWGIEALFALAWACNLTQRSLLDSVPTDFVNLFPSISRLELTDEFREKISLRPKGEIVEGLDLLFCLSSAKVDRQLQGDFDQSQSPDLFTVQQRRLALEWLLGDEEWEEIVLDT